MGKSAEELRTEIAGTRQQLGQTLEAIGDRVSPGRMIERKKNRITQGTRSIKDRVMGTVGDAGHNVSEGAHEAIERVHDTAGSVRELPDTIRTQSRGNPLIAGGVAFGVGFLAAVALPASRTEREATSKLLDKAEPIKNELTTMTHDVVDQLAQPAHDAVAEVKSAATDAATHVTDVAKDSAHQATEHAGEVVDDLRSAN